MRIAVTSKGTDLESLVDPRFGRAKYILVIDTESYEYKVLDNSENTNALKGAGIQAAAMVSDNDAEVVFTGFCGPNAFKTLTMAGIKVVNNVAGTVRDAVKAFQEGKVTYADMANADGHW